MCMKRGGLGGREEGGCWIAVVSQKKIQGLICFSFQERISVLSFVFPSSFSPFCSVNIFDMNLLTYNEGFYFEKKASNLHLLTYITFLTQCTIVNLAELFLNWDYLPGIF